MTQFHREEMIVVLFFVCVCDMDIKLNRCIYVHGYLELKENLVPKYFFFIVFRVNILDLNNNE